MKILLHMVWKDFKRALKHPWSTLVLMSIPVLSAWLMAVVFGTGRDTPNIVLHVAILDQDEDFIAGMIRSMGNQGDANKHLKFHFVDEVEEGIQLLEKRRVSAFLVFPENMTSDLLDGATVTVDLYKNPAQQILPQIVEQGTDLLAVGISELVEFMGPEMKSFVQLFENDELPTSWGTAMIVYKGMQKLEAAKTYLFPPLLNVRTIQAHDYIPSVSRELVVQQDEKEMRR